MACKYGRDFKFVSEFFSTVIRMFEVENVIKWSPFWTQCLVKACETPGCDRPDRNEIIKIDEENGITYIFSQPSNEYFLYLIYKIKKINSFASVWHPGIIRNRLLRMENATNIFEILRNISPRWHYLLNK